MTPAKEAGVIITNFGRPVNRFPLFIFRRASGEWLNLLARVDVSDVGNDTVAEPFYVPLVVIQHANKMTTVEIRMASYTLVIFIAPRKVSWYVSKPELLETE